MIIILIFFPLTLLFVPSKYGGPQDHQNNLNRKIGKWENRKMGIGECSMIFAKIVSECNI